jgi:hypothetical protein
MIVAPIDGTILRSGAPALYWPTEIAIHPAALGIDGLRCRDGNRLFGSQVLGFPFFIDRTGCSSICSDRDWAQIITFNVRGMLGDTSSRAVWRAKTKESGNVRLGPADDVGWLRGEQAVQSAASPKPAGHRPGYLIASGLRSGMAA